MFSKKKSQIAIEFLILLAMSFFIIISFMIIIVSISKTNARIQSFSDIDDLGKSLQQEVMLASQLEDGYIRKINVPVTLNGLDYNISYGESPKEGYIFLGFKDTEAYYFIPKILGNITRGDNYIRKNNGILNISQS